MPALLAMSLRIGGVKAWKLWPQVNTRSPAGGAAGSGFLSCLAATNGSHKTQHITDVSNHPQKLRRLMTHPPKESTASITCHFQCAAGCPDSAPMSRTTEGATVWTYREMKP